MFATRQLAICSYLPPSKSSLVASLIEKEGGYIVPVDRAEYLITDLTNLSNVGERSSLIPVNVDCSYSSLSGFLIRLNLVYYWIIRFTLMIRSNSFGALWSIAMM